MKQTFYASWSLVQEILLKAAKGARKQDDLHPSMHWLDMRIKKMKKTWDIIFPFELLSSSSLLSIFWSVGEFAVILSSNHENAVKRRRCREFVRKTRDSRLVITSLWKKGFLSWIYIRRWSDIQSKRRRVISGHIIWWSRIWKTKVFSVVVLVADDLLDDERTRHIEVTWRETLSWSRKFTKTKRVCYFPVNDRFWDRDFIPFIDLSCGQQVFEGSNQANDIRRVLCLRTVLIETWDIFFRDDFDSSTQSVNASCIWICLPFEPLFSDAILMTVRFIVRFIWERKERERETIKSRKDR